MPAAKGNHTPHMYPTLNMMAKGIDALKFNNLRIPIVCNMDGQAHTEADVIKQLLKD